MRRLVNGDPDVGGLGWHAVKKLALLMLLLNVKLTRNLTKPVKVSSPHDISQSFVCVCIC